MKESNNTQLNAKLDEINKTVNLLHSDVRHMERDQRDLYSRTSELSSQRKSNTILEDIADATSDQWFGFIFLSLVVFLAFMLIAVTVSKKDIECHYTDIGLVEHSSQINYKMMGFIDWSFDKTVVSTANKEEFYELTSNLKLCATN